VVINLPLPNKSFPSHHELSYHVLDTASWNEQQTYTYQYVLGIFNRIQPNDMVKWVEGLQTQFRANSSTILIEISWDSPQYIQENARILLKLRQ
jgi:hypothetical protein